MNDAAATRALESVLAPIAALIAGVAVWWTLTTALAIPSYYLPAPDAVAAAFASNPDLYLRNAAATLEKIAYGGAVGVAAGFVLAVAVAYVPLLRRILFPYLVAIRVLPKIAVAPLLLIYYGTGTSTAILFVALIAFFPMVVTAAAGFERAPRSHLDLLRSVGAGPIRRFVYVTLPYALPDLFAGLKQSITLAVVGAVIAEWIVADAGLGYLVLIGSENLQTEMMLAALLVLLALGLLLYGAVVLCQRAVPWDVAARA